MIVTADARLVFDEPWRGIAKTTVGMYRALAAARPTWRFRLFHRDGVNPNPFADLPNVVPERIDLPGDRFGLWDKVRLPAANVLARPAVFHAPAGVGPRFPLAPLVATIHDLIPIDTRAADPDVVAWGRTVRRAATKARVVLTPSDHAKGRIVALFGLPPEKVTVVRWGPLTAPAAPPTADELAKLRATYQVPAGRPFVLHFGMADPRKNTARVLDAWARLPADVRAGFALLVVGVQGPALARFRDQAAGVGPDARVHGYVPEDDAKALLAGAAAVCYPTLYEGFGLPVLDAFAAGVPVLSSTTTSVPEVAGDAAELIDPADTDAIAGGLARLLADPGRRAELVRRGRERAELFTWARCGEQVAAVFERVAGV